jgi:hypothetical protein
MASASDREAREARNKRDSEQKQLTNLLRQARASGYAAVETKPGEFAAVRNRRILGTVSTQLAEAVVADAKAKFAAQQKAKADALEQQAIQAQVNAEKLLQQIAQNTKAGPIV